MDFWNHVSSYLSVLTGGVLFFALGLWLRLSAARAAELKPKSLEWVRNYRSAEFPFRKDVFGTQKLQWAALLAVIAFAALAVYGAMLNSSKAFSQSLTAMHTSRYVVLRVLVHALGAGAVYLLLETLYDSIWAAVPAALLFAASPVRGNGMSLFLAGALFFLLLYLRQERKDVQGEIPYFAACLLVAPMIALVPGAIWLAVCFVAVHWYKLLYFYRNRALSGRDLLWPTAIAVAVWILTVLLGACLYVFRFSKYDLSVMLTFIKINGLSKAVSVVLSEGIWCFQAPEAGMAVPLLMDAPLLGFGFWGCFCAWMLGVKRRNARGIFVLIVCAVLVLFWLMTGAYNLTLPLALAAGGILADAELGQKRWICIVMAATGICWYLFLQIGAWSIPLAAGVLNRLK